MKCYYLVIPQIRVQTANMLNASFLIGGPPVLTSFLFAHALAREEEEGNTVRGIVLVHHQTTPLGQFFVTDSRNVTEQMRNSFGRFYPQQRRAASFTFGSKKRDYAKNSHSLSLQPVANTHMLLSLVIKSNGPMSPEKTEKFLYNGRFSGGQIISHGKPDPHDELKDAIKAIRSGYFVMDRKDLLEPRDGKNQAELMIEHLGRDGMQSAETGNAWLSAACLGYAGITNFASRKGAREASLHAFVEPLVGLVQYQSVHSFKNNDVSLDQLVWRPQWDTTNNVYRIFQSQ